jgi:hypothetical protein
MPVIPALGRWRQEDHDFKASHPGIHSKMKEGRKGERKGGKRQKGL